MFSGFIRLSLAIGAVLVVALASGCADSDGGPGCGPSNCAGCCTTWGECKLPSSLTSVQCGRGGGLCQNCSGTDVCIKETGVCGQEGTQSTPTVPRSACGLTCDGCCQINAVTNAEECVPYGIQTDDVCGEASNRCAPCASGETCKLGACEPKRCEGPDCPCQAAYNECFSRQLQTCVAGNSDQDCGNSGGLCEPCDAHETCVRGRCQEGGSRCEIDCAGKGCCTKDGKCVKFRTSMDNNSIGFDGFFDDFAQSDSQCGSGGQLCEPCGIDPRYRRPTTCNTRGQCVAAEPPVEICVNVLDMSCAAGSKNCEDYASGDDLYVEVEVGEVEERVDADNVVLHKGHPSDSVVATFDGQCVEVDGREMDGRQVTFRIGTGGFLGFGGKTLGTCRASISAGSYRSDSGGGENIKKTCSNRQDITEFTVSARAIR